MKPARWLNIICILVLLFAQHEALAHAAWHQTAPSPVQHLDVEKASFGAEACDFHGVFAQVLGAAAVTAYRLSLPRPPRVSSTDRFQSRLEPDFPAYRSRGPPPVLS